MQHSHDERLTAIETTMKHLLDVMADIQAKLGAQAELYRMEKTCNIIHDSARKELEGRFDRIEADMSGLGRRVELADAKAVCAVDAVNTLKATMSNRFWDVFKQILIAAILAGAAVLIYAAGTSGTTVPGRMPKAPGSQFEK